MESSPATIGTGSVKRKCAPPLGRFEPEMLPPCAAMIDWQMASPMPIPASLVLKKPVENVLQVGDGNARPIIKNGKDDGTFCHRSRSGHRFDGSAGPIGRSPGRC